ncbi:MAG: metal-sensitive transcriptional regulator [Halobacteriovoraceae bacterium]|jgi:DNA-binding FrmR family transcriptional regulator|nr:metal-sensitive transcriptional regulator [Halobacteriovoraceae bacterium]
MEKKGADHKSHLARVNRIEGQAKGIKGMIEEGKYCVDILTQIKAIRSALKGLELQILEGHANHCLLNAVKSGSKKDAEEKINEIMELIKKSSKS